MDIRVPLSVIGQKVFVARILVQIVYEIMERHPRLLVTEKEQAEILGISWHHLTNLRAQRLIPFVKLGKSIRYNPTEVEKALKKLTVEEHSQPPARARR